MSALFPHTSPGHWHHTNSKEAQARKKQLYSLRHTPSAIWRPIPVIEHLIVCQGYIELEYNEIFMGHPLLTFPTR
jgi:hypothetical protein